MKTILTILSRVLYVVVFVLFVTLYPFAWFVDTIRAGIPDYSTDHAEIWVDFKEAWRKA